MARSWYEATKIGALDLQDWQARGSGVLSSDKALSLVDEHTYEDQ